MRVPVIVAVMSFAFVAFGSAVLADAPVSASATLDKRGITIGDPIALTLVIEADAGYAVSDSGVGRTMGEFEILEALPPQLTKIANGRTRYTFRYKLTAFRVGDLVFPAIGVTYQGPGGAIGVAPTAEIPIVITTVVQPGESTDDIKPWKPQLRLPGAAPQISPIVVQAALAVVVLVMLALIIRQTRRAAARRAGAGETEGDIQLTPAQRAMAELNRVAALGLPEKGRYAEHYALLSRALRAYVRDRLRDGEVARFHRSISYPARAHHALRSALDAMRRAAVAEQYDLMQGQPS